MNKAKLCLHTGAATVSREQVMDSMTPQRTNTWVPISHGVLIDRVQKSLEHSGLRVVEESHGLTKDGQRYFGLMQLVNGHTDGDYGLVVGLRNSHDKSFPAGLVVGSSVFVCDNLSFSGEIKLARKHTVQIERDLPMLIDRAVGQLADHRHVQSLRFDTYKHMEITDAQAHDLIIKAYDSRILPVTALPEVLKQWREPNHPEFKEAKTLWRLFNAFTECAKGNLNELPRRSQALHGICDTASGLIFQKDKQFAVAA